jgi:hypothetical protein
MSFRNFRLAILSLFALLAGLVPPPAAAQEKHLLYVSAPGVRNYVDYGGVGVMVFDIDRGHRFVKRIPTWEVPAGQEPENVKGIAANGKTGKLYISTLKHLACIDLATEKMVWD